MSTSNQIGRYKLERKLGEGSYAEVWLALDAALERPVALKILKPAWMADGEARARFLQEARILANLHHPRIAWVWDLGEADGRAFLALRFVDGPALDRLLKQKGRLEWDAAVQIVAEAAEGLEYAHRKGLVHRDVKPQNILVSAEEGAVLTDFGLVRALEGSGAGTRSSALLGTPGYMAPEIWDGLPAGPAADQYALACVLVELVSGRALFGGPSTPAIMKKHFQPPELPAEGLPPYGRAALQKALSADPAGRFESMAAFGRALTAPPSPVVVETPRAAVPKPAGLEFEATFAWLESLAARQGADLESPTLTAPPEWVSNEISVPLGPGVEMVFVRVPAGKFWMGAGEDDQKAMPKERPQHEVALDEYWIGKYPVTNAQFGLFVQSTGYQTDAEKTGIGYYWTGKEWVYNRKSSWKQPRDPGSNLDGKQDHPVVLVSWSDASAFCAWAAKASGHPLRLPTEAEWEKAARGTDGRIYPWGNTPPSSSLLNYQDFKLDTTPVGSYPKGAGPYGALDMAGNVWEWTADWFDENYYAASPSVNPPGPAAGDCKVMRGGAWNNPDWMVRTTIRLKSSYKWGGHYFNGGFRCSE